MTGKTHVLLGTATMAAIALKNPSGLEVFGVTVMPVLSLLTVSAGSYGPDIDIEQSKLGHKYRFLSKHMKHRGITHTLLVPAILLSLFYTCSIIPPVASLIFGFLVGWVTHIFADLFNKKGVPVLWPFSSTKYHLASFKTGTWHEFVFIIIWLGGLLLWWIKS